MSTSRRVGVVLVACASWLLLLVSAAEAQGQALAVDEYLRTLDEAIDTARSGVGAPTAEKLAAVRQVGRPVTLQLAGSTLELPQDAILTDLRQPSSRTFETAVERIQRIRSQLAAAHGVGPVDASELDAALADAYRELNSSRSLPERLWRFAEDLLARLAAAIAGADSGVGLVAAIVLGLLGVGGVWALTRRLLVVADEHAAPERTPQRRPKDLRALADAALARGDLEAAVRAEYQLLILQLARRGTIRDVPSLTPAEARASVRSHESLVRPVGEATGVFERMAYGARLPRADEVERMRRAVEEVAP